MDCLIKFDPSYAEAGAKLKKLASVCHLHLKTNFRDHITLSSKVAHHCLGFMFSSDDSDHKCPPSCGDHSLHCPECNMPVRLVDELTRLYESVEPCVTDPEERLDLNHEIKTITHNILVYVFVGHLA